MKNTLLIGTLIGAIATTAIFSSMTNNTVKKMKRAVVRKIEDVIM